MAKGFGGNFSPKVREKPNDSGYQTIFEQIVQDADGKEQSYNWYRNKLRSMSNEYKVINDEQKDRADPEEQQDTNVLRTFPLEGHLYFFEYQAKTKWLPYYDTFPLVYLIKRNPDDTFWGANLHYVSPKKRIYIINSLKKNTVNIPRNIIHKYINKNVTSFFLDLAADEWETAILLPVENFVNTKGTGKLPYDKNDVWKEIDKSFNDKIKGERIIKGYNSEDKKRVK